jgi:hypothetical protein
MRTVEEIIEDSKNIDTQKIATETLNWVIANVEGFIDNQNKMFKLDLVIENVKWMEETKKLQDLYRAIPEDQENEEINVDKSEKCRRILDEITTKAFSSMKESELLKTLFGRMVFFYEKPILNMENKRTALKIDEELKVLFNEKEAAKEEDKYKVQERIVEKIKEGEKLVKFTQLDGDVNITNFEYEAFDLKVQIKEGKANKKEGEERKILKEYEMQEGFTLWLEINFKHKQRPTNMF